MISLTYCKTRLDARTRNDCGYVVKGHGLQVRALVEAERDMQALDTRDPAIGFVPVCMQRATVYFVSLDCTLPPDLMTLTCLS